MLKAKFKNLLARMFDNVNMARFFKFDGPGEYAGRVTLARCACADKFLGHCFTCGGRGVKFVPKD